MDCLAKYIGLPFEPLGRGPESYDCWGLVCAFYRNEFDVILPDLTGYESVKQHEAITGIVESEKPRWKPAEAEFGNVIVFNMAGRPVHVGIIVDNLNMLHIQKGKNSCLERFRNRKWKNRIEGIYRPEAGSYKCTATSA